MQKAILLIDSINNLNKIDFELSKDRKEKSDSYRFEDDKKRCILAELLLRKGLATYGYKSEGVLNYRYNEFGKPYILASAGNAPYFSLSHSKEYVACIICESEIGIDIEKVDAINLNIAERFFCNQEYSKIMSLHDKDDQLRLFYDIWTKKEAYLKFTGKGMHLALNSFSVYDDLGCSLKNLKIIDGYSLAVCSKEDLEVI